jgi:hypothetical protein
MTEQPYGDAPTDPPPPPPDPPREDRGGGGHGWQLFSVGLVALIVGAGLAWLIHGDSGDGPTTVREVHRTVTAPTATTVGVTVTQPPAETVTTTVPITVTLPAETVTAP